MADRSLRIALALPHAETAAMVRRALGEAGMRAVDGAEALAEGCDAALIAHGSGASGVVDELRSNEVTRYAPLVALTPRRAVDSGAVPEWADECLASPFSIEELALRLENAAALGRALCRRREETFRAEATEVRRAAEEPVGYNVPSQAGRVIAGCRIERKLTASRRPVFLAEHIALGIPVCVKLIPAAVEEWSPAEVDRFMRGARAVARVEHPAVVPVLNSGKDGEFYFVVRRYVEGESVAERLDAKGAMDSREAVRIVCRVAEGLGAAHALQLIHRDVKPANVILTPSGDAKLIDFGLARPLDPSGLSSTGEVIGTPQYMSPEQCDGDVLDARADVYSLGATLYHMVCGRPPFEADSLIGLIRKQIAQEPVPPVEAADVPQGLSDVIMRMMAKSRGARYASSEEVVSALLESSGAPSG